MMDDVLKSERTSCATEVFPMTSYPDPVAFNTLTTLLSKYCYGSLKIKWFSAGNAKRNLFSSMIGG